MYILFVGVFYCFPQFYDHTNSPILSTNSLRQTQTHSPETWQLSQRRQRQMYNEFNNMSLTFDSVIFHFHFFSLFFRELSVWCSIFHFIVGKEWVRVLDCWCEEEAQICLSLRVSEDEGESILERYCIRRHYKFLKYFMQNPSSSPSQHPVLLLEE